MKNASDVGCQTAAKGANQRPVWLLCRIFSLRSKRVIWEPGAWCQMLIVSSNDVVSTFWPVSGKIGPTWRTESVPERSTPAACVAGTKFSPDCGTFYFESAFLEYQVNWYTQRRQLRQNTVFRPDADWDNWRAFPRVLGLKICITLYSRMIGSKINVQIWQFFKNR